MMKLKKIHNLLYILFITFFTFATVNASDDEPFRPPGRFVNIGFQTMYIDCVGNKSPTILIDVGIAGSSASWYKIAQTLSNNVRTCLYDRAGYGWSDPGRGERTTATIVHELNLLINKAEIPGPFVLVGHSFGGFTARYLAARFPKNVVGLVLVDSSHPDQIYRLSALDKVKQKSLVTGRKNLPPEDFSEFERKWYFLNSSRKATLAQMGELKYFKESAYQVKHSGPIKDIPVAVLSRGIGQLPELSGVSLENEWQDMQKDLLKLSRNSWHLIVTDSGHEIHREAPNHVIENILKVVNKSKNSAK
jgi:pimeloyl-ACP methyl ester carboxylesterase